MPNVWNVLTLMILALGLGVQQISVRAMNERLEHRLHELQHGYNGLDNLHDRVTMTQIEQLRLQRQLDNAPRPTGAKPFLGEAK